MFRTLRKQLALQFVLISIIAYLLSLSAGAALFYEELENDVREELKQHLNAVRLLVDVNSSIPRWKDRQPLSFPLLIIQLFDSTGKLLDQIGTGGTPSLHQNHRDLVTSDKKWCVLSMPLGHGRNVLGYLQVQTDLKRIDNGVQGWLLSTCAITVVLLGGLILAGIVVSSRAVRPIEQASDELRRFMADAGHELGTPIAIIQANVDTLTHRVASDSESASLVEIISRTTEHMGTIVNDLLFLSTADLKPTEAVCVPLHELVEDTLEDFSMLFQEKAVNLVSTKLDQCTVEGNPAELQR
jgi:signal transduction histidine kinase